MDRKQMLKNISVPTSDLKVRQKLREVGEPMTCFGEGPGERRMRLTDWITQYVMDGGEPFMVEDDQESEDEVVEEFYTYGIEALGFARRELMESSIARAKTRLDTQREELKVPYAARKKLRHELYTHLQSYETKSLQFGDERPMGFCRFSPNSKLLATAGWSGSVKLWSVPGSELVYTFKGHHDRASGLDFHPQATLSQSPYAVNLASCASDGSIHLWSFKSQDPIGRLEGHDMRVTRVAFHPSGRFIGSASFDTSWRFWDVETRTELLLQEGHSREIYAIDFQHDGSLVATAGMDSIGRVWDLRTGRSVMVLSGHVKSILALDWSPSGYELATGSDDNTIRVWDIRMAKSTYTVPAHKNIVTQVRYWHASKAFEHDSDSYVFPGSSDSMEVDSIPEDVEMLNHVKNWSASSETSQNAALAKKGSPIRRQLLNGSFLASSSYDGTCKIWTDGDYKPLRSLSGLEGKVMCTDISPDAKHIAASLYDRTFKIFGSHENL